MGWLDDQQALRPLREIDWGRTITRQQLHTQPAMSALHYLHPTGLTQYRTWAAIPDQTIGWQAMEPRINLVTLSVPDVGASVDFYRRAFGWEPVFMVEGTAFFDLDGIVFGLWSGLSEELGREADPPPGSLTLAHNVRSSEEVDEVIAAALAGGARVAAATHTQPWGGYSGHIADPDGHLWEIAYNPDWPLDERGRVQLPW